MDATKFRADARSTGATLLFEDADGNRVEIRLRPNAVRQVIQTLIKKAFTFKDTLQTEAGGPELAAIEYGFDGRAA